MKQAMIVKPGTLSAKDKEKLTKNGYLVIEHPFPADVRIVSANEGIDGNDILMSALAAVDFGNDVIKGEFARSLIKRIKASEQQPPKV